MALPILVKRVMDTLREQQGNPKINRQFMELDSLDMVYWEEDFLGDTLIGSYQTATNGTAAAALAITAPTSSVPFGTATMESGTDDNGYSAASLGLHFRGEYNAVMAAIISVNTVTACKVEVGWTDTTAGTDAGQVNAIDTPTLNATNAAVWLFDTDSSTKNDGWYGISSPDGSTTPVTVSPTSIGNSAGDTVPVADTRELMVVALQEGSVKYLRGENLSNRWVFTYESAWQASGITATTSLSPWLFVQARSGSANRILTIDKLAAWCWRSS